MKEPNEAHVAETDPNDFLTMQEVARKLRFSTSTLRRHMRAGHLAQIEWVDFLQNGKLRAKNESVDAFIESRRQATEKAFSQIPGR